MSLSAEVPGVLEAPPVSVSQGPCGVASAGEDEVVKIGFSLGGSVEKESSCFSPATMVP